MPKMMFSGQSSTSGNDYSELKPLGRKIMLYIEKIGADNLPQEGLPLDSIVRNVPGANMSAVEEEVENLLSEGLLYTTNDASQCVLLSASWIVDTHCSPSVSSQQVSESRIP